MLFLGEYEHSMDAKNRLAIPAEIRDVLDPKVHGETLVIVPGANGLLWMWPQRIFGRIAEAFGGQLIPSPERAKFEQRIFSKAARLTIDSAGRVRLPERLVSEFGLGQTVVILGVGHHLELCDAAARKRQLEGGEEPTMEEIWDIARRATDSANANEGGRTGPGPFG